MDRCHDRPLRGQFNSSKCYGQEGGPENGAPFVSQHGGRFDSRPLSLDVDRLGDVISPTEHSEENGIGRNRGSEEREDHNAVNVVKLMENVPTRTRLVRLEDTRTAVPSNKFTREGFGDAHVCSTKLHVYPGCRRGYVAN